MDASPSADERRKVWCFRTQEWWTRSPPIRTAATIPLEWVVFTSDPFLFQRIAPEAQRLSRLGMSVTAIARALGVDFHTARDAIKGRSRERSHK